MKNKNTLAVIISAFMLTASLGACGSKDVSADGVINVPQEVSTIKEAVEVAKSGDMVLIAEGTYKEDVRVTTPDIVIRGTDRNKVIVDGDGKRPYAIVVMADGVRVENLTVSNATFYGLLFTGLHEGNEPSAPTANDYEKWEPEKFPPLQRFLADHITAINNGLYGIYAFNSQHGIIRNSYASGSADSGFYIGQCTDCDILLADNVAERNAVGYENSNASDSVYAIGNRFSGNRMGITLLSSYQEEFLPQRKNYIYGNVITDNNEPATPAQASGGFGTGIGISGGVGNLIEKNVISGHKRAGIIINNSEDLPAMNNIAFDNIFATNKYDIANQSAQRSPAKGNCVAAGDNAKVKELTFYPAELKQSTLQEKCTEIKAFSNINSWANGVSAIQPAMKAPWEEAPKGISYRKVAYPKAQPNLKRAPKYSRLPAKIELPNLSEIKIAPVDLLLESTGTR